VRITGQRVEPVAELAYRAARRGGGTETVRLAVGRLAVDAVPAGVDAVLVTADLQGIAPSPRGGPPVLLGAALADYLPVWAGQGLIPPPERLAVLLAGDLYSAPTADLRGATGPVADVWWALASVGCRLVAGVVGNHDVVTTGDVAELGPSVALLDGTWVDAGSMRVAVVGGWLRERPPALTVCGHIPLGTAVVPARKRVRPQRRQPGCPADAPLRGEAGAQRGHRGARRPGR
jgi:3',5'-cyclic-AMP phosphodiesterase